MSEALRLTDEDDNITLTAEAAYTGGEVAQLADGRAGVYPRDVASGALGVAETEGQFTVAKTTSMVFLDGGRVYWDHSANKAHFKKVSDRDFYIGRAVGDAASAATTMVVNLNVNPPYDLDIVRDPYTSVLVGTAALNGLGYPYRDGGALRFNITATSEAQKVDALSVDGFALSANAIIEGAFRTAAGGSGSASDFSIGVANASHASNADTITDSLFIHLDGGSLNILAESDDGTTEVAATDTTADYATGLTNATRTEFWLDMRNPADVQIYIDGALVLPSTVFNLAASVATWYLLVHLEKSTGTETADLIVDWLKARFAQQ